MSVNNSSSIKLKKLLFIINHKFKFQIIYLLTKDKMRFGELKVSINNITQQLLTKLLKELERDSIITRKQYNGFPRRVEYSLSGLGISMKPMIKAMLKCEEINIKSINKVLKKKQLDSLYDYY